MIETSWGGPRDVLFFLNHGKSNNLGIAENVPFFLNQDKSNNRWIVANVTFFLSQGKSNNQRIADASPASGANELLSDY